MWLPIDSKFPQEDYLRLQDAANRADSDGVKAAVADLHGPFASRHRNRRQVRQSRRAPRTSLSCSSRRRGCTQKCFDSPASSRTSSTSTESFWPAPPLWPRFVQLRMGFQTLAIEQRTAEVWNILAAAKTEFVKFADVLDKVKRDLRTASETLEQTSVRSRAIERQLRTVEQLPEAEASKVLALPAVGADLEPVGAC